MKTRTVLFLLILILLVVSCIPSLYPLYREKDLLLDERLVGQFNSEGDLWQFEKLDPVWEENFGKEWIRYKGGKTYKLTAWEKKEVALFAVHLIRLDNNYYLDFYPVQYNVGHHLLGNHLVPAHSFCKLEFVEEGLVMFFFNCDYLKNLIDSNKVKISHKVLEYTILLTAQTEELQRFVRKYGNDPKAFVDPEDPDTLYRKPDHVSYFFQHTN